MELPQIPFDAIKRCVRCNCARYLADFTLHDKSRTSLDSWGTTCAYCEPKVKASRQAAETIGAGLQAKSSPVAKKKNKEALVRHRKGPIDKTRLLSFDVGAEITCSFQKTILAVSPWDPSKEVSVAHVTGEDDGRDYSFIVTSQALRGLLANPKIGNGTVIRIKRLPNTGSRHQYSVDILRLAAPTGDSNGNANK